MTVWNYLTPRNLLDLQREQAIREMGERARKLLADGYAAEADRVLDELYERTQNWKRSGRGSNSENPVGPRD